MSASDVLVVTKEMLAESADQESIVPEVPSNVRFDLGNLMSFIDIDVPIKRAKYVLWN